VEGGRSREEWSVRRENGKLEGSREEGKGAEKLHTNPKAPQERETRSGAVVCPGQRWLSVLQRAVATAKATTHTHTRSVCLLRSETGLLLVTVRLSGREHPRQVTRRILWLFSTSLQNPEPLQLPRVPLDPESCLPYFQQKDLLEHVREEQCAFRGVVSLSRKQNNPIIYFKRTLSSKEPQPQPPKLPQDP